MTKSIYGIIAAVLIAAVPIAAPAQFSIGVGFTVGVPPPPMPVYSQPVAPYPNYMWTPGYWAWGPAGYYWVPGTWVAPPSVGMYWTPGYWGATGGGYGWNAGYWGPSVGFYGGINYGFGYPGTGFYGGAWNGGNFAYNTAYANVNKTIVHNTYNKTVINKNVCNNCVSYNGGKGGTPDKPTPSQINARKNGKAPTTAQKQQATIASQDRNQLASVNKGKPTLAASQKPFSDTNKPRDFAPVTAADKQNAQKMNQGNAGAPAHQAPTTQNKQQQQMHAGQQQQSQPHHNQQQQGQMQGGQQQSQPHHRHNAGTPPQGTTQGNPGGGNPPGGGKHGHKGQNPPPSSGQPPLL